MYGSDVSFAGLLAVLLRKHKTAQQNHFSWVGCYDSVPWNEVDLFYMVDSEALQYAWVDSAVGGSAVRLCTEIWSRQTCSTLTWTVPRSHFTFVTLALLNSCVLTMDCSWRRATRPTLWPPRYFLPLLMIFSLSLGVDLVLSIVDLLTSVETDWTWIWAVTEKAKYYDQKKLQWTTFEFHDSVNYLLQCWYDCQRESCVSVECCLRVVVHVVVMLLTLLSDVEYKSHAIVRKPRDAVCFFLCPVTLWLLFVSGLDRSRSL